MAKNLQTACEQVDGAGGGAAIGGSKLRSNDAGGGFGLAGTYRQKSLSLLHSGSSSSSDKDDIWLDEFDMDYLSDEVKFTHNRLYGADLLITEGLYDLVLIHVAERMCTKKKQELTF